MLHMSDRSSNLILGQRKKPCKTGLFSGARGGTRTRTGLLPQDFKSWASTNSATRAKTASKKSPPAGAFL